MAVQTGAVDAGAEHTVMMSTIVLVQIRAQPPRNLRSYSGARQNSSAGRLHTGKLEDLASTVPLEAAACRDSHQATIFHRPMIDSLYDLVRGWEGGNHQVYNPYSATHRQLTGL